MRAPTLLVLAAGMGSRYGGLKQMDAVGTDGETILDYSIYDALRAGFGKVVVVLRREIEQAFRESVGSRIAGRVPVEYVFQELRDLPEGFPLPGGRTKPWGTAHAVLTAAKVIHEPFAVINADDFYGAEGYRLLEQHLRLGSDEYAMVGFVLRKTLSEFGAVARGLCYVDGSGYLQGISELTHIEREEDEIRNTSADGAITKLTGDEMVSMNFWGFSPSLFDPLREYFREFLKMHGAEMTPECYLPNAVGALLAAGTARVKVLPTSDAWFGVTYREDRAEVVANIARLTGNGEYPKKLWA